VGVMERASSALLFLAVRNYCFSVAEIQTSASSPAAENGNVICIEIEEEVREMDDDDHQERCPACIRQIDEEGIWGNVHDEETARCHVSDAAGAFSSPQKWNVYDVEEV